jgi:hypothetical protein
MAEVVSEGGCLCRTIRYRVSGPPDKSIICHCATCRRASAAPSVAWLTFDRTRFEFISGTPTAYHSSPGVVRRFCNVCGSGLSYENAEFPATIDITTVSMDDPDRFAPLEEVWLAHRISWEAPNATLRPFADDSAGGT